MGILQKISRSARNSYAPLALRCGGQQFFFLTRPTIGDKPRKTRKTWTFWKKPIFRRSDFGHVHISGMVRAGNYLFISCIYPSPIWYNTRGWAAWWVRKGSKIDENRNKNDNVVPPVILKIHTNQTRFLKNGSPAPNIISWYESQSIPSENNILGRYSDFWVPKTSFLALFGPKSQSKSALTPRS